MLKRAYEIAWLICLMSWIGVLINYELKFSFIGCIGRRFIEAGLCSLVKPIISQIFPVALISLPLLTFVLLVRMVKLRRFLRMESLLALGSWLLFAASVTHIPSS
jgi:hypothetical protein